MHVRASAVGSSQDYGSDGDDADDTAAAVPESAAQIDDSSAPVTAVIAAVQQPAEAVQKPQAAAQQQTQQGAAGNRGRGVVSTKILKDSAIID